MLSEKIYELIVANYPPKTDAEDIKLIQDIVNMFYAQFAKDMEEAKIKDFKTIKIIYQRLCLIWDTTSIRLEKEGKSYLKKGGFKTFMESKPEFNEITK